MISTPLKLGQSIPGFELKGVDNNIHTVALFENYELLLIVFSCNHCPYVKAYEGRIKDLQSRYRDGMQVVAINSNDSGKYHEDSFENMKNRARDEKFNFVYLIDETQETAKAFGASHTPEFYLFNKERKLVYRGKFDDNWKEPEKVTNNYLIEAIDEVLARKEVSVPETFSIGCTIKWK